MEGEGNGRRWAPGAQWGAPAAACPEPLIAGKGRARSRGPYERAGERLPPPVPLVLAACRRCCG